jgi:hypothetical protein
VKVKRKNKGRKREKLMMGGEKGWMEKQMTVLRSRHVIFENCTVAKVALHRLVNS